MKIRHLADIIYVVVVWAINKKKVWKNTIMKKEYRSAIRSRKLIRQAFMELLKEKSFEKITVTDIVNRADINRSTFYAHYPDVMGLLDEIQEEIISFFEQYLRKVSFSDLLQNPTKYLRLIIKMAGENEELYRLLSNSHIAVKHMENMKKMLAERIMSTIEVPERYLNSFEFEFAVRFFLGGFVDVYTQWLKGEINCTVEDIIQGVSNMVTMVYHEEK